MNTNILQTPFHSRRTVVLTFNIAVLIMLVIFIAWIERKAENSRIAPPLPVAGTTRPIQRVSKQRDAYPIYKAAGLRGARVIHLNRFFNMQNYSPKEQFVTTEFPLRIQGTNSAYEPGIDSHSWLFIATRTGLVRTVTTVLPEQVFGELLRKSPDDKVFTYTGGTIRGYTFDIPRTITTLDALPVVDEPVVVNVDAGFFTGSEDPGRTAAVLKEKCRDVRMMVLIDSLDKPEVTDEMRERLRRYEAAWTERQ